MKFAFEARVVLNLEHTPGKETSSHAGTDFNLFVKGPLDESKYKDADDYPTAEGSRVLTNVLVQGLIGNIHMAHDQEFRDSAEHLRYIIGELERGFVAQGDITKSQFE